VRPASRLPARSGSTPVTKRRPLPPVPLNPPGGSHGAAGPVLYAYDEAGHLLGEYDGTGSLIEKTVWLGDIPVATLRPSGSTVAIYYVHSDQLNAPRQVARPSDNTLMWT
jgi:hypothetical protein